MCIIVTDFCVLLLLILVHCCYCFLCTQFTIFCALVVSVYKDVTPIEEALAYRNLLDMGSYTVQSLAERFGKSEDYIRTRLKFASLIPEIAALLNSDEITVSLANEICHYSEDIQKDVYE